MEYRITKLLIPGQTRVKFCAVCFDLARVRIGWARQNQVAAARVSHRCQAFVAVAVLNFVAVHLPYLLMIISPDLSGQKSGAYLAFRSPSAQISSA
jgi:hypothetical protein